MTIVFGCELYGGVTVAVVAVVVVMAVVTVVAEWAVVVMIKVGGA